jgi:hypothetical protein
LEECGPCPVFASYTLAFAVQLRKKHGKPSGSIIVFCYTLQHVSAVQTSLHEVDVGYTKRSMKGERESRCLIEKEKYEGREGE